MNPYLHCGFPGCRREPVVYVWLPLSLPVDHPNKVMVGLCEYHEMLEAGSATEGRIYEAACRRQTREARHG